MVTYHCLNSEAYGTRLTLYTGDELDTVETKYKKSTKLFTMDECVSRVLNFPLALVNGVHQTLHRVQVQFCVSS